MQDYISSVVNKYVKKFSTRDPFLLAEKMGIQVVPWHFTEEVQGMYRYVKRNKFIFINKDLGGERTFVCAHELGHAILHPTHNTAFLTKNTLFPVSKYEKQANKFAVELLLPDEDIYAYQDTNLTIQDIGEIYGIPREVAHLKNLRRKP